MDSKIKGILNEYVSLISGIYKEHLSRIILYGSYARGDYDDESDIDIMILVDLDNIEIKKNSRQVSDATFDINYDNNVMIMPSVQNKDFFEKWIGAYPFYNNINNEGIELYAV